MKISQKDNQDLTANTVLPSSYVCLISGAGPNTQQRMYYLQMLYKGKMLHSILKKQMYFGMTPQFVFLFPRTSPLLPETHVTGPS